MLFNGCVRGALLHASECWALRREDIQRLLRNEWAMLRWLFKVKAEDDVSLHDLCSRLNLLSLESRLRINRFRWYGHVERSENWINCCTQINVSGCQVRDRPCKSWKESVTDDLHLWNIAPNIVHDRSKWKKCTTKDSHKKHNSWKSWKRGSIRISKCRYFKNICTL